MKMLRVDRGAIKFVLAGANIMCPGLTSAGGALDEEVPAEAPVVITWNKYCFRFLGHSSHVLVTPECFNDLVPSSGSGVTCLYAISS